MPGSLDYPEPTLSRSSSIGSSFDSPTEPANFDMDDGAFRTNDRNDFYGFAFQLPNLETDVTIKSPRQCLGGSQRSYTASTPQNNGCAEKWESPCATPPPYSSSPDLDANSSPAPTHAMVLAMLRHADVTTGRPLSVGWRGGGESRVKALFNGQVDSNASIFPAATSIHPHSPTFIFQTPPSGSASLHRQEHPANTSDRGPSMPACSAARGLPDAHLSTMSEQPIAVNGHGICAATTRTSIEATSDPTKTNENNGVSARGGPGHLSRKRALVSAPTMLDISMLNESEPVSSGGTDKHWPCNATTTTGETKGNSDISSKLPYRRVPIVPVSRPAQSKPDNRLKRQRSSIDCPPESKKAKLERTVSHISYAADSNVEPKYQATEPASLRRAQSLRSEVSSCSNKSANSLFYPSPLSSPSARSGADKDYPPTVPSTPLPDSVDYARSKANPMVRTIRYYRRRSLEVPPIPPVPIIAPPEDLPPTTVRCSEDYAIDRIKALLQRQRGERERDGLDGCDDKRAARLKEMYGIESAISRRYSGNTSDSSVNQGQWEEVSTLSATESQESEDSVPGANVVYEQHRLGTRDTWSDAFGITDDFRKQITGWMLKKRPKAPVPRENPEECRDKRPLGTDLYDQLINSPQTRFHAAQLFHRYFLLPDKVDLWRETCMQECFGQESCEAQDEVNGRRGVWALAVACIALAVKVHRDCWPPLASIPATELIALAPYSMTHNAFELAQRDLMYTFQFLLGTCTPQDVLDELWDALPTLRKATATIRDGWTVVQSATWDRLFESLLEPDMLQYPVTLLTAAALVDGLVCALGHHCGAANVCKCKALSAPVVTECVCDDIEPTSSQTHLLEANQLVENVILDVQDVLELSKMELDECRKWLSHAGK